MTTNSIERTSCCRGKAGHACRSSARSRLTLTAFVAILVWVLLDLGITISVTRFGEILPLGQTFKSIRQTFEGLFSVWKSVKPTLAKKYEFGQI